MVLKNICIFISKAVEIFMLMHFQLSPVYSVAAVNLIGTETLAGAYDSVRALLVSLQCDIICCSEWYAV